MAKGLFIASIIGTLPEIGTDVATQNWGDLAATAVEDLSQAAMIFIEMKGPEWLKKLEADAKLEVLQAAILFVETLNLLNGFGQEDEGTEYETAQAYVGTAELTLRYATPNDEWQGDASRAYTAQNLEQLKRLQAFVHLDSQMKEILEREAGQVELTRNAIGGIKAALNLAIYVAMALYAIPSVGPELSMMFQVVVALGAVVGSFISEITLLNQSIVNRGDVQNVVSGYQEIAAGAKATLGPLKKRMTAGADTAILQVPFARSGETGSTGYKVVSSDGPITESLHKSTPVGSKSEQPIDEQPTVGAVTRATRSGDYTATLSTVLSSAVARLNREAPVGANDLSQPSSRRRQEAGTAGTDESQGAVAAPGASGTGRAPVGSESLSNQTQQHRVVEERQSQAGNAKDA
ncbi:EspA/EspE family type VII secretion system effector [Mycobacterium sp. 050134]|uniref:EspA/EspE family type VII secretion system effector n=1 Tax=Mycobacterium sp. 050134 TaxID=3096111 RepID=UPI002EDA64FB